MSRTPVAGGYQAIVQDNSDGEGDGDSDSNTSGESALHGTDYDGPSPRKEPSHDRERRRSFIEEDEESLPLETSPAKEKKTIVSWSSLPHKSQLAILVIARLSEPLVQSSLRSYLFYQLKSFDTSLPDSVIASQAGVMQGSFAAAQLCTAMLWGRFSDRAGRKRIILIGLFGTMISSIGFGFSRSFWTALIFRLIGGALNGNLGVLRTMISEIVREKKYQSRAFLLLPMCANVGVIVGPLLGGITSDPATNYPDLFGGIRWLEKFPYSPPNLLSAVFLFSAAVTVFFVLEETHDSFRDRDDIGLQTGRKVASFFRRLLGQKKPDDTYSALATGEEDDPSERPLLQPAKKPKLVPPRYTSKLPFHRIFTYNVVCTLIAHSLLAGQNGTFQSIWYSFLSTPVYNPEKPYPPNYTPHPPLFFNGGIGLPPRSVGAAMAILGTIGITLQLVIYPIINARIGTVRSWRIFLYWFPLAYVIIPFLALIPSTTPPPSQKTGPVIWAALTGLLFIVTVARTFAGPASIILINNCSPHPSVLGTIHGIAQSVSSGARTIGPAVGGFLYGQGLEKGCVGAVFWGLAVIAGICCFASTFVKEGNGHEIRLGGDDEAEEEAERINREQQRLAGGTQ